MPSLPVQLRMIALGPVTPAWGVASPDSGAPLPSTSPPTPALALAPEQNAAQPAHAELPMVDGYVLRKALTRAPVALTEVVPLWPEGLAPNQVQEGRFTLFIGASGRVDRIEPDGPSLFPALEASARAAFSAARFQPGEVAGRVVKSVIRIEVVFDPRPTQVPGAVVVSRQNL